MANINAHMVGKSLRKPAALGHDAGPVGQLPIRRKKAHDVGKVTLTRKWILLRMTISTSGYCFIAALNVLKNNTSRPMLVLL